MKGLVDYKMYNIFIVHKTVGLCRLSLTRIGLSLYLNVSQCNLPAACLFLVSLGDAVADIAVAVTEI